MNNNNFDILGIAKDVMWVPKYGAATNEECKLYCRVTKTTTYFLLKEKVKDGTSCTPGGFNKCVNGKCLPAGCDNMLFSTTKLDKCGVCKGRNETCSDVNGALRHDEISMKNNRPYYVVTIPKGATNIEILQPGYENDRNYIALKEDSGKYILNDLSHITPHHKSLHYAGVTLEYNGGNSPVERINSTFARRLERNLYVEILSLQPMSRVDENIITFSYSISKNERTAYPTTQSPVTRSVSNVPQWKMSEWSDCDQLCFGKKFRTAACVEIETSRKIAPSYCRTSAKPADEYEVCNTDCKLS